MKDQADGESFRMLFVCTGNTCRSPLAEVVARRQLAELGWRHVEVRSAGAFAGEGFPPSEGALRVAEHHGLDLTAHRTSTLTPELVEWADVILAMAGTHLLRALELGGDGKVALLTEFASREDRDEMMSEDVPDPFGGDDLAYEQTYQALEELVDGTLRRLETIVAP